MTLFVTVGNGKFDPLIKEIDRLVEEKKIDHDVIIQIGHGSYKPKNCHWFTFAPSLQEYYRQADLVIGHGGPGTVFEVLRLKKPLIALPNRDRTDPRHQVEYLRAISKETAALLYCDKVQQISAVLEKAKNHKFTDYQPPECRMHEVVHDFLARD